MRTRTAVTINRSDYREPELLVDSIELEFDLEAACTRVKATLKVRRNGAAKAALVLDGEGLRLLELRLDDRILSADAFKLEETRLTIDDCPPSAVITVINEIFPERNTALDGLYVSNGTFLTQCEAQGFRRITFFPDRPDVMARYRVLVRAERASCPVLLANGNLIDQGECSAERPGWHWALWEDPFPKPSYLFALVAGKLAVREQRITTRSGRAALLQAWVEPGNKERSAHALASLVRAISWDEERFGLELDLERFMIVATDDFNMGAMENKGLNIFNSKYVFANQRLATDSDFRAIESVVGHEYFHNWTGNRVTCRDWFQLTLKEGLTVFRDQEFSADMRAAQAADPVAAASARTVGRIDDVRALRSSQFPEDAGPMAHPIRPESYREINNFYTTTVYEKGAEVVRMLQTLVGVAGFRKGIECYFARHDGHAVTCDDFVAAIAAANGRDLEQFSRWYSRPGTPVIEAHSSYDPACQEFALTLRQRSGEGQLPLHIPFALGLVGPEGRDVALRIAGEAAARAADPGTDAIGTHTMVLDLRADEQRFVFADVPPGCVPSLLRGFSAPVIVEAGYSDEQLLFLAGHDPDPFNRWEAMQSLALRAVLAIVDGAAPRQSAAALVNAWQQGASDESLDPAYRDQLIALPPEAVIAEHVALIDPVAVRSARNALRLELANALAPLWPRLWRDLSDPGPYRRDAAGSARRALRNTALAYWVATGRQEAYGAAAAQFAEADNMTDRAAALQALVDSAAAERDPALASFAQEFHDEPLALDKWFAMQATMHRQSGEPPVLARVRALLRHPAFSLRNPNRVRSLIGSFCHGNAAEFHAADGSGYEFWIEQVLALDAINPQVAARIARAFERWPKYTPERRHAMRSALLLVADQVELSADVREIVDRSLAQ